MQALEQLEYGRFYHVYNHGVVRVWQLGRQDVGRLLLDADLTDAYGTRLPAGTYNFTFFGVAETSKALGASPPQPGKR